MESASPAVPVPVLPGARAGPQVLMTPGSRSTVPLPARTQRRGSCCPQVAACAPRRARSRRASAGTEASVRARLAKGGDGLPERPEGAPGWRSSPPKQWRHLGTVGAFAFWLCPGKVSAWLTPAFS